MLPPVVISQRNQDVFPFPTLSGRSGKALMGKQLIFGVQSLSNSTYKKSATPPNWVGQRQSTFLISTQL